MEKLVTYKKYIFENAPLNVDDESDQFEVANCNVISVQTICNTVSGTVAIDIQASNVGVSALAGSTLLKKHNVGDYESAQKEFLKWNKAAGKELAGLTKRRNHEPALYGK